MTTETQEIGSCRKLGCGGTVYRHTTGWWIVEACNRCGKGWGSSR